MMQMTHICITRGLRVPESLLDQKTSFQTRPTPPGDAQPENVDSAGPRLSRGAHVPSLGDHTRPACSGRRHADLPDAHPSSEPVCTSALPWERGKPSPLAAHSSALASPTPTALRPSSVQRYRPSNRSFHLRLSRKSTHYRFSEAPSERGSPEPHPAS